MEPSSATLLGSPIGDVSSTSATLTIKTNMLKRMGERLQCLTAQDALLLLKHSFALPKLLYNLRTAPCFLSPVLQEYDELLKSTLSGITNIHFQDDDPTWTQATLPVRDFYNCTFSFITFSFPLCTIFLIHLPRQS